MQESRQIHHHYLRQAKSASNIETHGSRVAERTAQTTSTLPSLREAGLDHEDAMNWKDFLSHSHLNHDAARCATCLAAQVAGKEGDVQGPKLKDLPPVLPPLRPLSPMMRGLDKLMWKRDGPRRVAHNGDVGWPNG
ncbi:hypothetical protein B5807_09328 [Epicoccum nigrum]|jgi:hypothetical protein|uniref:Uncharacterized protein n=1 Tax=Epicoccum nigrum TaxID=105696 RepID=A0A1Y2LM11_EPING|nr:hypothetical protein B5807_09328 [Epicoccum nigrum]